MATEDWCSESRVCVPHGAHGMKDGKEASKTVSLRHRPSFRIHRIRPLYTLPHSTPAVFFFLRWLSLIFVFAKTKGPSTRVDGRQGGREGARRGRTQAQVCMCMVCMYEAHVLCTTFRGLFPSSMVVVVVVFSGYIVLSCMVYSRRQVLARPCKAHTTVGLLPPPPRYPS